jgi:hypothetical protein
MKQLTIVFFVLSSLRVFGQNNSISVQGKVLVEGKPIAYANIGIVNKNVGTVSDESGFFDLTIPPELTGERIRFSCVGYETQEYVVGDFIKSNQTNPVAVNMKQRTILLEPVIIKPTNSKTVVVGSKTESTFWTAGFPSQRYLGSEVGSKFNVRKKRGTVALLEEFSFFVASNVQNDTVSMRLNIYNVDDHGLPSDKLLTQDIILKIPNKSGWVLTDLSQYGIYTTSDFVITLEWIDFKSENTRIRFSTSFPYTGKLYFKKVSQGKWETPKGGGPIGFNIKISYVSSDE